MTPNNDHENDDPHGAVPAGTNHAARARAGDSTAPDETTHRIAVTGSLDEPHRAGKPRNATAAVRFDYTFDDAVTVNFAEPFDPGASRRVAERVMALCMDPASGWKEALGGGLTRYAGAPIGFTVTYTPATGLITVLADKGVRLSLVYYAAKNLASNLRTIRPSLTYSDRFAGEPAVSILPIDDVRGR